MAPGISHPPPFAARCRVVRFSSTSKGEKPMKRFLLLTALSAVALAPQFSLASEHGSAPKGAKLLYTQNSNPNGNSIVSDNVTDFSNDFGAADDFVVPKKSQWTVTEVDTSGVWFDGSGPAASVNVIFYKDDHGQPGKAVKKGTMNGLSLKDENGNFAITFPGHGLKLKAGTYWVSVIANCMFANGCGEWGWDETNDIHGNQAVYYSNDCSPWCGAGADLMFDLQGVAKR
jgi:hypothetical protein